MSATPALDELAFEAACRWGHAVSDARSRTPGPNTRRMVADIIANPDLVLAALIESGWTPSDDQLRAMGGTPDRDGEWLPAAWWHFPKGATDG